MAFQNERRTGGAITPTKIVALSTNILDAFGRLRVSTPFTIFDSKQLYDGLPEFWDETITNASGNATSIHNIVNAATDMYVEAGDSIVRQTFQRFNYQPGKSQLVMFTVNLGGTLEGVTARVGYFDENNGVFFMVKDGDLHIGQRKDGVDTTVARPDWNIDRFDGTDGSGIDLQPDQAQILIMDMEWLGTGTVRYGFVLDGVVRYVHATNNANTTDSVYISTPNNPLRYEVSTTNASATLQHICSMVASEGGVDPNGLFHYSDMDNPTNANSITEWYALKGIRLKANELGRVIDPTKISLLATTNDNLQWGLFWNPTVDGTFTYSVDHCVEIATGDVAGNPSVNTLSDLGQRIDGGYMLARGEVHIDLNNKRRLGASIGGTRDQIVLAVQPFTTNLDVLGGIGWREI